jgi:two-component system response regulator FixJ
MAFEPTIANALVYIVDDDPSVRKAITRMFKSLGMRAASFATAREFMDSEREDGPGCLILDVQMPDQTGIELQEELVARHIDLPIVFLTGHGNIPMTVQAMRSGAVDFLTKPLDQRQLVDTVCQAIEQHARQRTSSAALRRFREKVDALSKREYQVMTLAVGGMLNKQIARRLGITEHTVKVHRGRVMNKTGVSSIAELARLCEKTGIVAQDQ